MVTFDRVGCCLLLALWGLVDRVQAEEYHNDEYHFSISIPNGWERMTADEITALQAEIRQRVFPKVHGIVIAFKPPGYKSGDYPYILVQQQPMPPGVSFDQLETSLESARINAQNQAKAVAGAELKDISLGQPQLDREKQLITNQFSSLTVAGEKVRGHTTTFLGREHMIAIHCLAKETQLEASQIRFSELISSFRFDPSFQFSSNLSPQTWANIAEIVIVSVLVIFALITVYRSRRQTSKTQPTN